MMKVLRVIARRYPASIPLFNIFYKSGSKVLGSVTNTFHGVIGLANCFFVLFKKLIEDSLQYWIGGYFS